MCYGLWAYIFIAFNTGRITRFVLIVEPYKLQSKTNKGLGFQMCWKNCLCPVHRSRDMAHAQWLQKHCHYYPMETVITHKSQIKLRYLVADRFEAGSKLVADRFEPCLRLDSVMEFGFEPVCDPVSRRFELSRHVVLFKEIMAKKSNYGVRIFTGRSQIAVSAYAQWNCS